MSTIIMIIPLVSVLIGFFGVFFQQISRLREELADVKLLVQQLKETNGKPMWSQQIEESTNEPSISNQLDTNPDDDDDDDYIDLR